MPNATPRASLKIPRALHDRLRDYCKRNGTTISKVVARAIRTYIYRSPQRGMIKPR